MLIGEGSIKLLDKKQITAIRTVFFSIVAYCIDIKETCEVTLTEGSLSSLKSQTQSLSAFQKIKIITFKKFVLHFQVIGSIVVRNRFRLIKKIFTPRWLTM